MKFFSYSFKINIQIKERYNLNKDMEMQSFVLMRNLQNKTIQDLNFVIILS